MTKKSWFYRFYRFCASLITIFALAAIIVITYFSYKIPSSFYVTEGNEFELKSLNYITGGQALKYDRTSLASRHVGASQTIELKLFGAIPIKPAHISVISKQEITPGGTPFGIKLFTKGVIVVDINSIETKDSIVCPAKDAGIKKGDVILTADDREVKTNEDLAAIINAKRGEPVSIVLSRDGSQFNCMLTPAISKLDGGYKGGLWVRDSSAGIGTVTYYNKATGVFGGLGHGICDTDTLEIMPLASGEVCSVQINSVVKGAVGSPGELRGMFTSTRANGRLMLNNDAGIYGYLYENPNDFDSVDVMLKQDISLGDATIICTLEGNTPKEYSIQIDKIDLNPKTLTKNMTISITDPELIAKTGGIVQGMSGSPILQNGKLVGAVTHVFVNNPQKGYGIFAENMLQYSNTLPAA